MYQGQETGANLKDGTWVLRKRTTQSECSPLTPKLHKATDRSSSRAKARDKEGDCILALPRISDLTYRSKLHASNFTNFCSTVR